MQTFLPTADFGESAKILDSVRLNKQIVEASQILNNILQPKETRDTWKNHPALLMWDDHPITLCRYIQKCIEEWYERKNQGHKDLYSYVMNLPSSEEKQPYWIGDFLFHSSHRSSLLLKDEFYWKYEWDELNQPYLCYVWPSFYLDFNNKILSKKGIKSLMKSLKRRNLWKEDYFRWPGSNAELRITINTGKLI